MVKTSALQTVLSLLCVCTIIIVSGCCTNQEILPGGNITSSKSNTPPSKKADQDTYETSAPNTESVPVLLYHHVLPRDEISDNENGMIVPVEEFQSQMAWLKENGYVTPTLPQLLDWLNNEGELPPKSVVITFDDGYISIKDYVFPILKENGLKAVAFVIGARADGPTAGLYHLSWDDIISIQTSQTIDFQNHTYDGHTGTHIGPDILSWPPERFSEDLQHFEDCFEDHGLDRPLAFSYPFGAVNNTMTDVLSQQHYKLAFATKHGFVKQGDDPLSLKRIIIWPGTELDEFEQRISVNK